jgi:transcriptional regulator with XRE-family HTH domain
MEELKEAKRKPGRPKVEKKKLDLYYPKSDKIRPTEKDIAERIKVIRHENGLTIDDLYLLSSQNSIFKKPIGRNTVIKIVNGKTYIDPRLTYAICKKLGYSTDWLLYGTGEKRAKEDKKLINDVQEFIAVLETERGRTVKLQSHVDLMFKEIENLKKEVEALKAK